MFVTSRGSLFTPFGAAAGSAILCLLCAGADAQTVTYAGFDGGTPTAAAWRDASVAKPTFGSGSIGANNIYGTDGYYLFNTTAPGIPPSYTNWYSGQTLGQTLFSTPAYVSNVTLNTNAAAVGFNYGLLNKPQSSDPTQRPTTFDTIELGDSAMPLLDQNYHTIASFKFNNAVPASVRLGYVFGCSWPDLPDNLRIVSETNPSAAAEIYSGAADNLGGIHNTATFNFFDISGAHPGDVFDIQVQQYNGRSDFLRGSISGLTFDSPAAVPEMSSSAMLIGFLGAGLAFRQWRKGRLLV